MDFAQLKRNAQGSVASMQKALNEQSTKSFTDDRYWKLSKDKSGNGSAIIRFLPISPKDKDLAVPWVLMWKHGFQGPTGLWYIEKSLTTIGQTDPVSEHNTDLWQTGDEAKKNIARKQKRQRKYIANILVIKDPSNSDYNGKVMLFEFGQKIHDMIQDKICPEDDPLSDVAADPIDVFNLWEGCNFIIRISKADGQFNYTKSEFAKPSPVASTDEEIEEIWNQEYSLSDLVTPDKFKPYEVLKSRLDMVLGLSGTVQKPSNRQTAQAPAASSSADMPYLQEFRANEIPSESADSGALDMNEMNELLESLSMD